MRALAKAPDIDPGEAALARLEPAEKALGGAEEYIARGDAVQASEKLYKAVKECIKALAEKHNVKQLEKPVERGEWGTWLLGMAATDLARRLGEERIRRAWAQAHDIHVWGFHDAKYRVEDVEAALPLAKWLLEYTKKTLEQGKTTKQEPPREARAGSANA